MTHQFGPGNAVLTISTGRTGTAAKIGHDLLIEVGSWSATLDLEAEPALTLVADSRSLRVLEGSGGPKPIGDEHKEMIANTIDNEILRGCAIAFRSTRVDRRSDEDLAVDGELELAGGCAPISFGLTIREGRLTGRATVTQTSFGMELYSSMLGALRVADDVQIKVDAELESGSL